MESIIASIQNQLKQKKEQEAAQLQKLEAIRGEILALEKSISLLSAKEVADVPAVAASSSKGKEKVLAEPEVKKSWADQAEEEEEDERKMSKSKWYTIFDGSFKGIYNNWEIASQHIRGKNVRHKSYSTKEEAQKALENDASYSAALTKPAPPVNRMTVLQKKIPNPIDRIRSLRSKEEVLAKKVLSKNEFSHILNTIENYQETYSVLGFYPVKHYAGPKVIFVEGSDPLTVFKYFLSGVIDVVYTDNGKEFEEFPVVFKSKVKEYIDKFAKERKVYLKFKSSYPVFQGEDLRVPAIHLVNYGIATTELPPRDEPQPFEVLESIPKSLMIVYLALQKQEEEINYLVENQVTQVHGGFIKVLYGGDNVLLYSRFPKPTSEGGRKAIAMFSRPFEDLTGNLSKLPEDIAKSYCQQLQDKVSNHSCQYCRFKGEYTEEVSPLSESSDAETVYSESKDAYIS